MLAKGIIQLDKKCDTASINVVAFGSFEPIDVGPIVARTVEFRLIHESRMVTDLLRSPQHLGK